MYDQYPPVPLPIVWNLTGTGLDPACFQQSLFELLDAFRVQEIRAPPVGFVGRKGADAGSPDGLRQTAAASEQFYKEDPRPRRQLLSPTPYSLAKLTPAGRGRCLQFPRS